MLQRTKGQATSFEFFLISGVIVLAVMSSFQIYDLTNSRTSGSHQKISMEFISIDIMDGFIKTPGNPDNWQRNINSTLSFGLVDKTHEMNFEKIDAFSNFDYNTSKRIMGIENFDYFFSVTSVNDTVVRQSGIRPFDPDVVVNPRMLAKLGEDVVFIDFMLWR